MCVMHLMQHSEVDAFNLLEITNASNVKTQCMSFWKIGETIDWLGGKIRRRKIINLARGVEKQVDAKHYAQSNNNIQPFYNYMFSNLELQRSEF